MSVVEIETHDDFERLFSNESRPIIVDFTAAWCGPCKQISPVFHNYANQYGDHIVFAKVDVDKVDMVTVNVDQANVINIINVPTFISFHNTKVQEYFAGAKKDLLEKMVMNAISLIKSNTYALQS